MDEVGVTVRDGKGDRPTATSVLFEAENQVPSPLSAVDSSSAELGVVAKVPDSEPGRTVEVLTVALNWATESCGPTAVEVTALGTNDDSSGEIVFNPSLGVRKASGVG